MPNGAIDVGKMSSKQMSSGDGVNIVQKLSLNTSQKLYLNTSQKLSLNFVTPITRRQTGTSPQTNKMFMSPIRINGPELNHFRF